MKRSPYRDYLDGEIFDPKEVVYLKVIDTDANIRETEYHLRGSIPKGRLRSVIRPQAGAPGISGLYIYAHTATMEQAEKRLMLMLKEENEALVPVNIRLRTSYRTESDAMQLLHTLGNCYEPVRLLPRRKQQRKSAE